MLDRGGDRVPAREHKITMRARNLHNLNVGQLPMGVLWMPFGTTQRTLLPKLENRHARTGAAEKDAKSAAPIVFLS